jgi:hypothetical protein
VELLIYYLLDSVSIPPGSAYLLGMFSCCIRAHKSGFGTPYLIEFNYETVEKPAVERLMENVHMQGLRNPEE